MTNTEKVYEYIKGNGKLYTRTTDVQAALKMELPHIRHAFYDMAGKPERYPNIKSVKLKSKQAIRHHNQSNVTRKHNPIVIKNLELA